jgi:hypothetical protein
MNPCFNMTRRIVLITCIFLYFLSMKEINAQAMSQAGKVEIVSSGKHALGEVYGGGKIFWLDEKGQHGLVAATTDQSASGTAFNPGTAIATGAGNDGLYAGQKNTEKIVGVQGHNSQYAARLCIDFTTSSDNIVYNDWYLPSKYELDLLFRQKMVVGGFNLTSGIYWSSTESTTTPQTSAWEQEFRFGSQWEDDKDLPNQVRCIRKF